MDPIMPHAALTYRVEFRGRDGRTANLAGAVGLRAAATAFEREFRRLARLGELGTLALLCEVDGLDAPIASRLVVPGGAD
jgi:hypothetical protein